MEQLVVPRKDTRASNPPVPARALPSRADGSSVKGRGRGRRLRLFRPGQLLLGAGFAAVFGEARAGQGGQTGGTVWVGFGGRGMGWDGFGGRSFLSFGA